MNKIIEFDGVYYHKNTPENIKRSKERDDRLKVEGYSILHI
jgi:very-short-patch-repair endonuclease